METDIMGNFLSGLKGVKDPFESQKGRWDFSQDAAVEKGLISRGTWTLLFFPELWQETWGSSRVTMGTSGTRSCGLTKVQSPCELRGASRDSSPGAVGPWCSSRVQAGASELISSADIDLRIPVRFLQGSQAPYRVETGKSTFLLSWKSSVRLPVQLT